jgi:hypothetical protein
MLKKAVQQGAASKEVRRTLRYVGPLIAVRTTLANFVGIPPEIHGESLIAWNLCWFDYLQAAEITKGWGG